MAGVELRDLPAPPDTESTPGGMKTRRCRTSALAEPAMGRVKSFLLYFFYRGRGTGDGGGQTVQT